MKTEQSDVLVIGGGLAGCVAAKAALDAGASVTMIFPDGGASELSSGAADVAGVVPGQPPKVYDRWAEGADALTKASAGHPYAQSLDTLQDGLDILCGLAAEGGEALQGFEGRNVWLPNVMGTFSLAAFVPQALAGAVPGSGEHLLVAGFAGNVAFNAAAAAMSYSKYQKKIGLQAEYLSASLTLPGLAGRRKLSDGELAAYLDTDAGMQELAEVLRSFCSNNRRRFDSVLLPPVLGFTRTAEILQLLQKACGCRVAEVLTSCNCVVGWRMTRALYRALEKSGVQLVRGGRAVSLDAHRQAVTARCTLGITDQYHPGTPAEYTARAAVLATGGFLGGGIEARHTSVWINLLEQELGQVAPEQLSRNVVDGAGQDVLRMGVACGSDLAVLDESLNGRVFACGEVLAGFNSASERSGAGVAAATGCKAGRSAAQAAKQ